MWQDWCIFCLCSISWASNTCNIVLLVCFRNFRTNPGKLHFPSQLTDHRRTSCKSTQAHVTDQRRLSDGVADQGGEGPGEGGRDQDPLVTQTQLRRWRVSDGTFCTVLPAVTCATLYTVSQNKKPSYHRDSARDALCDGIFRYITRDRSRSYEMTPLSRACLSLC